MPNIRSPNTRFTISVQAPGLRQRTRRTGKRTQEEIGQAEPHRQREEQTEADRGVARRGHEGDERGDGRADARRRHETHDQAHEHRAEGSAARARVVGDEGRRPDLVEPEHTQGQYER